MTIPFIAIVAREVEFAAHDHGKQNYDPLSAPSRRGGAAAAAGVAADGDFKHDMGSGRNWLTGLSFVTEVSGIAASGRNSEGEGAFPSILGGLRHI
jgi:hypothetical protein